MSRILVVRACAIGDFVLSIPALESLYMHLNKDVRLTLVGYASRLELAREFLPAGAIEAIHSLEVPPWSGLFRGPVGKLTADSAIVWMKDSTVAKNLRESGIVEVLHADPFPTSTHAADHLLRTLNLPPPPLPDFWQPSSDRIILHPGSGSSKKCWPHFHELADRLRDLHPFFLIGPNETGFRTEYPKLQGQSLREVAQHLRACRAFIGNDSGITHLAAYLGVPTVALFGPTDPQVWAPRGRRTRILWKESLSAISVDDVLQYAHSVT